jgi:hypothetical protein
MLLKQTSSSTTISSIICCIRFILIPTNPIFSTSPSYAIIPTLGNVAISYATTSSVIRSRLKSRTIDSVNCSGDSSSPKHIKKEGKDAKEGIEFSN